ncbi:MAG TPA: RNA polymerase sigma factor, partial [Acidimicrobiales bacterium]|nr:RNA polymerase sigma factor [Acidimicrobiales bacterium]
MRRVRCGEGTHHVAVSSVDDRRLVESHKAGDDEAFVEIVHAYWGELVGHAVRRLREPRAAEDAVQETMLRAYRALPRFNGEYRLGAWLHRILENVCADEGNRRRREAELVEKVSALPLVDGVEPHEAAAARMPDPGFVRALATLSPSYREALLLRYVDGLPYREIANATGVTEENARARVHRA